MSPEEELGRLLMQRGLKIAVAESCTGGLIANRITDIAGSSNYFETGMVTYSNRAKELFLSVPHDLIASKGAVSREVAGAMAEGVRNATGTDIGLAVTGIAGPGGGSEAKPVGTVYIGLAAPGRALVRGYHFNGDRMSIKRQTADEALNLAISYLEEQAG